MTFRDKVFAVVKKISKGKILTYKEVARLVNSPKSYRAVGNVLHTNFDKNIPCHRVIRSDGITGGYNRGNSRKLKLLKEEGAI